MEHAQSDRLSWNVCTCRRSKRAVYGVQAEASAGQAKEKTFGRRKRYLDRR